MKTRLAPDSQRFTSLCFLSAQVKGTLASTAYIEFLLIYFIFILSSVLQVLGKGCVTELHFEPID